MADVVPFGLVMTVVGAVALAAVLSSRLSAWLRVPAPVIFLLGAAAAAAVLPNLGTMRGQTVERIATAALVVILFQGGMHIGWRRLRAAAGAVLWVGIAGTFVTAGAVGLLAHALLGLPWPTALLLGAALAPTDPAVVFAILGRREVAGRTGTLLEGEAGVNDPVGITLVVSLLAVVGATGLAGPGAVAAGVAEFTVQLLVGLAIGVGGGAGLLWFIRRVPLPSGALYPVRVLACAGLIYGVATVAHGSGFLAVFVAGIVLGDARAPYKADIERFHASLANLAEIGLFIVLGLTIDLPGLARDGVWLDGLLLAVLLAFLVRPLLVGLVLWPVRLRRGERLFVLFAGLRGAVPILLGVFVLGAGVADGAYLYQLIFVVVTFSVLVQGGMVPFVADRLGVPMRVTEPEPWSLGVRFQREPRGLRRHVVAAGAPAEGATVGDLSLGEDAWVSVVIRDGHLVPLRPDTALRAGDEVLLLADPVRSPDFTALFGEARPGGSGDRTQ